MHHVLFVVEAPVDQRDQFPNGLTPRRFILYAFRFFFAPHRHCPLPGPRYTLYISFLFFSLISLMADGPHRYHPACGHKGSSHLSPVYALHFLSRCKFSTLTTRQPMVEFYLLTFPRFSLRKKEHNSYFEKNRTHDFRTI